MRYLVVLFFIVCTLSCKDETIKKEKVIEKKLISAVEFENILLDSTLSFRALTVFNDGNLGFAGSNNSYGLYDAEQNKLTKSTIQHDSLTIAFRSVASTSSDFFALSIGNPALLFKTGDQGKMELVYREDHEKVFYDALHFWNDQEGIAIGDTTDACISIIITRDGGNSWKKLSCDNLPKAEGSEGAFAASDTNIAIVGDKTWVATAAGRVYVSNDKGGAWSFTDTPMTKAKETEGIYSIDFYDELNGFAIGGDYTNPKDASANKIRTTDGGKTWAVVGANETPGYRSCVQYLPNSSGQELVALGFDGIDYSSDAGTTWKHLSDEGYYTIRFVNDSLAYAAGKGRISKLKFKR